MSFLPSFMPRATLAANPAVDPDLIASVVTLAIVLSISLALIYRERRERLAAQCRALNAERALASSPPGEAAQEAKAAERNQVMFDQHRRINQLTIAKLEAEIQLMQGQITQRETTDDRLEAGKEYHELMVEKTKLEMDSLRLHIAELRKRMDDWSSD